MILLKRNHPDAVLPEKKYYENAGWDFAVIEDINLEPGEQAIYDTGWVLEEISQPTITEFSCFLTVFPRSGLDASVGLHTGAGVIDYNYKGPILLLLKNQGKDSIHIEKGKPVAQIVPLVYKDQLIQFIGKYGPAEAAVIPNSEYRGEDGGITKEWKKTNIEVPIIRIED